MCATKPNARRRPEIDITQAPLDSKAETSGMPSSRRSTLSSDDMAQGPDDRARGRHDQADIWHARHFQLRQQGAMTCEVGCCR